jgi:hypothetical protein
MSGPGKIKDPLNELEIEEWSEIPPERRIGLRRELAQLKHSDWAMWVAIAALGAIGLAAVGVSVAAFAEGRDPPQWATSAMAAIIAAAVALVFNRRGSG